MYLMFFCERELNSVSKTRTMCTFKVAKDEYISKLLSSI